MEWLQEICARPWMGIYLRVLAVVMAYGGIVHVANILGFGGKPWAETPLPCRIGDVAYGILDIVAAVGLWLKTPWGLVLFVLLIASQFVIYTVFIDHFVTTDEERKQVHGLLGTEAILIVILIVLILIKK